MRDGPTGGRTDRRTNGPTDSLIEMRKFKREIVFKKENKLNAFGASHG